MDDPFLIIWIFFILSALQPAVQRQYLGAMRRRKLAQIAEKRNATVITLIHRQETLSFLGIPLIRHIDIDDSQSVLRAIRSAPKGGAIEIVLHTPGGLVLAASQIARALRDHDGRVTAVVPHYAMSGGTLVALAADEIVLDPHVALGPVDPQLGRYRGFPRRGRRAAGTARRRDADHGRHGRKAIAQVEEVATYLLSRHFEPDRARELARLLSNGTWTHDHPLMAAELEHLGFPIRLGVPEDERDLMDLYPQPRVARRRSSTAQALPAPRPGASPCAGRASRRRSSPAIEHCGGPA